MEPVPATVGRIRFVGQVPLEIAREVKKRGQGNQIILSAGGKIREQNHADRVLLVCQALKDMGLNNFMCSYNVFQERVDIKVNVSKRNHIPRVSDILKSVQKRTKVSQVKNMPTVRSEDININLAITDEPVMINTFHRGGMTAFNPGSNAFNCTTAWSVIGAFGDGIITAGHCNQPAGGLASYHLNQYGMIRISYVNGWGGDAAYYDINPDRTASPDFYADSAQVRTTRGIKLVDNMLGAPVCRYGRASNFRSCNHTVVSTFSCYHPGYWICQVVTVTNNDSIGGDSGGGWSWGDRAWGVQSGKENGNVYGIFMPVERIQNILGVYVKRITF